MTRTTMLLRKSKDTLKNGGVKLFIKKSILYIKKSKQVERNLEANKVFSDVLFINGSFLPHPARYRVAHQMEQLKANNISCHQVFFEDLKLEYVKHYRVFIFFRCIYNENIDKFIKIAKRHNKVVIYDIDDLVIDTKYTNKIPYIQHLNKKDQSDYNKDVLLMQKTLKRCDMAITSTTVLGEELKNYVSEVFVNRNTASEEMVAISQQVIESKKANSNNSRKIKMGYFSGSITHNDDFAMILPVIIKLLKKYQYLELHLVGEIDLPESLKPFKKRIITLPFVSWKDLPNLISGVDINLVPLQNTLFNRAKSENKWTEASLVKVVTVASQVGALEEMINDKVTGFLCSTEQEWYETLEKLIQSKQLRDKIADNAYQYVYKNCTTIYTGFKLAEFLRSKMKPNIVFVIPSTQISGGIRVILEHCLILKEAGVDVTLINEGLEDKDFKLRGKRICCLSKYNVTIEAIIDKCVATLWSTTDFMMQYHKILERYYLVQGFETDFNKSGQPFKIKANATYNLPNSVQYITISKWCQKWLENNYSKIANYAPNGIQLSDFKYIKRNFNKTKIRILIEGNSEDFNKNIDESFKITNALDPRHFEIWYMSYLGEAKSWYRIDKCLYKVPYEKVGEVYQSCDILLKSSKLESFSYPPLEMMATGGLVVIVPNSGNREYLINEENCLFYQKGNINMAIEQIKRICADNLLREKLIENGLKTARNHSWKFIKEDIIQLYNF